MQHLFCSQWSTARCFCTTLWKANDLLVNCTHCSTCHLPVSGPPSLLRICSSFFSSFSWRRFRMTSSGLEMLRVKLDSGSSLYSCCATLLSFSLPLDANISFCFFFSSFFSLFDNFRRKLPACEDALCAPWLETLSVDSVGGYDSAQRVKQHHTIPTQIQTQISTKCMTKYWMRYYIPLASVSFSSASVSFTWL